MRFPALRSRDFRLYLAGNFFALNANWILRLVTGWLGWQLTGSVTWTGILAFLLFAPTMVSGPLFGVVADRVDIRRAGLLIQSLLLALALLLLAMFLGGLLGIWVLAALALAFGIVTSAYHPIRMSMVPRLVERDGIANAISITSINFNLGRFIGPAVGGWLIHRFGAGFAIGVIVACYLPFIAALVFLRPRERNNPTPAQGSLLAQLLDGGRYAWRHPVILKGLALIALFAVILRGTLELLPALADGVYARGADGLGQAAASAGVGALFSSFAMAMLPTGERTAIPATAIAGILGGLALTAALGTVPGWWITLLLLAGMGFCGTIVGVSLMQTIQMQVDDAYRGRVMSLWGVVGIGGAATGAAVLGAVADLFGLPAVLLAGGLGGMAVAGLLWAWRPVRQAAQREGAGE